MINFFLILLSVFCWRLWDSHKRVISNPFPTTLVIGNKGSGKSLYVSNIINDYFRKGWHVYSNMGIGSPLPVDYYNFDYPYNSLLVLDEVGLIHDNRNFKNFPPKCTEFYKYARKNGLRILMTSQTPDVDKKIRDVTDELYVTKRHSIFYTVSRYKETVKLEKRKDEKGGEDLVQTIVRASFPIPHLYLVSIDRAAFGYDTNRKV